MMNGTRWIYGVVIFLLLGFAGCSGTDEGDAGISTARLQVVVTASPHGGPAPLSVSFWAAVNGNNGAVTYAWTFGDGATSTDAAPTHEFAQAGLFNVNLLVTDSKGSTAANGLTITVQAEPNVVVTATPEEGIQPLTVAFTCTNDSWTGAMAYFWEFGDGRTSSQQNPTHTYVNAGSYLATCSTAVGGAEASGSVVIEVAADSIPVVGATATPQQGIAPLAVQFSAVAAGGDGTVTIGWEFGDGSFVDNDTSPAHTYSLPGMYLALATATDADGDTASDVVEIAVGTDDQPAALALAVPSRGPAPLEVALSCPVEGGNPPFRFEWNLGVPGTTPVTSPFQSFAYTYDAVGNYTATCTVFDVDNDVNADTVEIAVLEPNLPPVVDARIVAGACSVPGYEERGGTTVLLDAGATDDDPLSYLWVFERVPPMSYTQFNNPTVANASFVPDQSGAYELRVTVSDGLHEVTSELLTVVASDVPAYVVPVGYTPLTGVAGSEIAQPLMVQVFNDCGDLGSIPLPGTSVRWYGQNAYPYNSYSYTDGVGYTYVYGMHGTLVDLDSSIVAVAGCVSAVFDLHSTPAIARYLVMEAMEPVPVTIGTDPGATIDIQLTDQYLNPVSGPQVVFDLEAWSPCCRYGFCDGIGGGIGALETEAMAAVAPGCDPVFDETGRYRLFNQTTDENGHFTTTVSHFMAEDAFITIDPYSVDIGDGEYLEIEGRGIWEVFADDFEGDATWNAPSGSQWEIGSPAAGVGPGTVPSGDNVLGTNLDGNLAYTPVPNPDIATGSIPFGFTASDICSAYLEFDTWYDMGRPCPEDCTNASGYVAAGNLVNHFEFEEVLVEADTKRNGFGTTMYPWEGYPGPNMCGYTLSDDVFAAEVSDLVAEIGPFAYWFGGESGPDWRTIRMDLPPYFDCSSEGAMEPSDYSLDSYFNLLTSSGEPLGPGWYIDDVKAVVLLENGRIPYLPGPPDEVYTYTEFGSFDDSTYDSCDGSWVAGAYVLDEYGNYVPGVTVDFTLTEVVSCRSIEPLNGTKDPGNAVFRAILEGDNPVMGPSGTARADTTEDGRIKLAIYDPSIEYIRLKARVGDMPASYEACEYFDQNPAPAGECCEAPATISSSTSFYPCSFRPNNQSLLCGGEDAADLVFLYESTYDHRASIGFTCYYSDCSDRWVMEVTEYDGTTCPGTFPPGTMPGNECQYPGGYYDYDYRYYYLKDNQQYLITIQAVDEDVCDDYYDDFLYFYIGS